MGRKIFEFIKKYFNKTVKILLSFYLYYWVIIIWQFDLNKTTYPLELFLILSIQVSFTISVTIYTYFLWFRNEINDKFNRNILIGLTAFTITAFPLTYGILIFGRNLSELEGVKIGSADGWLAFIGSIIGGLVTMIAVVITINNENKKRELEKEDREQSEDIEHIPLLKIIPIGFKDTSEGKHRAILFYDSRNPELIKFTQTFAVSNLLFNERPRLTQVAKNFRLDIVNCYINKPFYETFGFSDHSSYKTDIPIVLNNTLSNSIYPGYEDTFEIVYTISKSCINNTDDWMEEQFVNTSLNLYYKGHHEKIETCIEFTFSFRVEAYISTDEFDFNRYLIIQDSISNKIIPNNTKKEV